MFLDPKADVLSAYVLLSYPKQFDFAPVLPFEYPTADDPEAEIEFETPRHEPWITFGSTVFANPNAEFALARAPKAFDIPKFTFRAAPLPDAYAPLICKDVPSHSRLALPPNEPALLY